ncbi:MAG: hypothetical protein IT352_07400 [Gemmatimonadales bacterium]|nr:hypothetical protein [Gemmatimonadales bacterium]
MAGLIRSIQRDAAEQAAELEREAEVLIQQADQKRHDAAILRAMDAIAQTWTPRNGEEPVK